MGELMEGHLRDEIASLYRQRALLRHVLGEYVAGNQIVDGHWYAPDETGAPHYLNQPATPDELALIQELREGQ